MHALCAVTSACCVTPEARIMNWMTEGRFQTASVRLVFLPFTTRLEAAQRTSPSLALHIHFKSGAELLMMHALLTQSVRNGHDGVYCF
eukprot:6207470-Pleurochrysis_carterae.AAC.3